MNDINNDNPDFDKMSFEELRKWTFKRRLESIPHEKGIFELNKRMSQKILWVSVITLVIVIVGIIINILISKG